MKPLVELLGDSPGILDVRDTVGRLLSHRPQGRRRLPALLIQGETGTGKGLLARAIHRVSARARGPFIDVNCAAIPDTMLEAELFGYERGAFTDAKQAKAGLFQAAHQGTLFLDEIALLSRALQAKLLKVLENKMVRRLGSTRDEPVDVWVISATNEDLTAAIREGRFREDLYHRLAVITLALPPLRERGDDVILLARHFLDRACDDYGVLPKRLADDALATLRAYPWPGNARELGNIIERATLLTDASVLTAAHLSLVPPRPRDDTRAAPAGPPALLGSASEAMRERLKEVLDRTGWNISRTAAHLGIARNTVKSRIARLGLRETPSARTGARLEEAPGLPAAGPPDSPGHGDRSRDARLRWESRRVTALRVTLVSDDELPSAAGTGALDLALEKVVNFGGFVDAVSAHDLLALFGVQGMEDAPRRAADAALAVHASVTREHARFAVRRVTVRMALHCATVLVGHAGDLVKVSAEARSELQGALERLQTASAAPVVLSAEARDVLQRHFEVVEEQGDPTVYRLVSPSR